MTDTSEPAVGTSTVRGFGLTWLGRLPRIHARAILELPSRSAAHIFARLGVLVQSGKVFARAADSAVLDANPRVTVLLGDLACIFMSVRHPEGMKVIAYLSACITPPCEVSYRT